MPPIVRRIVRQADSGALGQAVDDAIMDYMRSPTSFDPARGSLVNYLTTAGVRNIFNLQRAESRRIRAEGRAADWLNTRLYSALPGARTSDLVAEVISECCSDATERAFARAWLEDASVDELAASVGLKDVCERARKQAVRRWTERLRLRFKRHFQGALVGRRRP